MAGPLPLPLPVRETHGATHTRVRMVGPEGLLAFHRDLEGLGERALEPNPFFEPWMLAPALAIRLESPRFLVAERGNHVIGLLPVIHAKRFRGLPIPVTRTWLHLHAFLGAPLVDRDHAQEALDALLEWRPATPIFELRWLPGDGPMHDAIETALTGRRRWESARWERALFRRRADAETFLCESLDRKKRKDLRRQEHRLAESGEIAYEALEDSRDLVAWIGDFLRLEAAGWKGAAGGAFASSESGRSFFHFALSEAFRRGRLDLLRLRAGTKVVAMKCNLRAAGGTAFAWKIAYDESVAKLSPGVQLELENVRRLHASSVAWMDSCADAGHPMIEKLWPDRRSLRDVVISCNAAGDALVAALPHLARAKAWLRRKAK